jgi:LmbE family N-acetylglucosaminyl deacetylase
MLVDAGEFILRNIKQSPPQKKKKTTIPNFVAWRHVLLQFDDPRIGTALLSASGYGLDLRRENKLPAGERILVIAAHQDDETIAAGGTLLKCASAGKKIHMVYVTNGSTYLNGLDEKEIIRIRKSEAIKIWNKIANITPVFFDYPNRGDYSLTEAATRLSKEIENFNPTDIFVPSLLEQAVEHRHVSALLLEANKFIFLRKNMNIWGYQNTTFAPGTAVVDISNVSRKKLQINRMWQSQNTYGDYANVADARDHAASVWLKGTLPRRHKAAAESFIKFPAQDYLALCNIVLKSSFDITPRHCEPPNFFVIGMQKCGTFWLTALLDAHPMIRCFPSRTGHPDGTGEAHIFDTIAKMKTDYVLFAKSMRRRLDNFFSDLVPNQCPKSETAQQELINSIVIRFNEYCHLQRIRYGKPIVGEKTTESCHYPSLLDSLYPSALRVAILRDPRDRIVSYYFHQKRKGRLSDSSELDEFFIDSYIERIRQDYEGLLLVGGNVHLLTYEELSEHPQETIFKLCELLSVSRTDDIIQAMLAAASFSKLTGREAGVEDVGSHYRKGVVGDWSSHLNSAQSYKVVTSLEDLTRSVEDRFRISLPYYR